MTNGRVSIYDTTLRDGAQGDGISFSGSSKLHLAARLDQFGVDFIEGGYAGSNETAKAFFRDVQGAKLHHSRVAAFGSTRRPHVRVQEDPLVASLLDAGTPVVTVVGKAWDLHVIDVLRTSTVENALMIGDTIAFLKQHGRQVFFDAEHFFDGYKANPEVALEALQAAVTAGADVLVLCDTNGGSLPSEVFDITREIVRRMPVPIGIHTHNDMGLAVANSLEAVRAGAVQVQGTINGIGERCGNADLCAIIPALRLKMGYTCLREDSLRDLRGVSQYLDELIDARPDPSAPFVGRNAFTHKAGLHADAVQKNPRSIEHIDPAAVGNERRIVVSEASGASSVLLKAIELGVRLKKSTPEVREVLDALKEMEARGYEFAAADASFRILVQKVLKKHKAFFDLEGFRVIIEKRGKNEPCLSEATVKLSVGGEMELTVAEGDGPVNALDSALRKALTRFYPQIAGVHLTDFRVRILDPEEATAAKTRVVIESSDGRETWGTVGVSPNIIEASWEALVDSVEYTLFRDEEKTAGKD